MGTDLITEHSFHLLKCLVARLRIEQDEDNGKDTGGDDENEEELPRDGFNGLRSELDKDDDQDMLCHVRNSDSGWSDSRWTDLGGVLGHRQSKQTRPVGGAYRGQKGVCGSGVTQADKEHGSNDTLGKRPVGTSAFLKGGPCNANHKVTTKDEEVRNHLSTSAQCGPTNGWH